MVRVFNTTILRFPPPIKLTATIYLIEVMIGKKTPFTCIYFFYFQIERDWKFIAMVIDRLFLYIFTIACVGGTVRILLYAPSLYDVRPALSKHGPWGSCSF
jgi:hypothetical protein